MRGDAGALTQDWVGLGERLLTFLAMRVGDYSIMGAYPIKFGIQCYF